MIFKKILKTLMFFIVAGSGFYVSLALAEVTNIGDIADTIVKSFESIGKLMIATAYISGIGFTIASVFKFKQHRDNPTQIPIGAPIALLAIGVILIFLPGIIGPVGETLFGTNNLNEMSGGFTGSGASSIPGGNLK
jgi:intracellular multiplication protein IcmD